MFEKNRRILIIDDNRAIHNDFYKLLMHRRSSDLGELEDAIFGEASSYQPECFALDSAYQGEDGAAMVRKARAEERPYALAIVDMRMPPGWDGLRTVEEIFKCDPNIQVVICTAYSDAGWSEISQRLGSTDRLLILKKPFDVIEVAQIAAAITEKWHLARAARLKLDELQQMVDEQTRELQELYQNLQISSEAAIDKKSNELSQSLELTCALELARDTAMESARLKSDFLSNVSHELLTPMNGVIGMADILLDTALTPEQQDYVETIKCSGGTLLHLINNILDYSQSDTGEFLLEHIEFSVRDSVEAAAKTLMQKASAKGVHVAWHTGADVPEMLVGDPDRLTQVLVNLIGNAVKFTDNGSVELRVTRATETADHTVLKFEVKDTGIGIPEQAQHRLFQPFVQVDSSMTRKYEGTGLGLALSKQLVELMGGTIAFTSVPQMGSTFWFTARFGVGDQPAPETGGSRSSAGVPTAAE